MFSHLAGNQRVKESLRRMLTVRRVPGALLFAGEEGVGKKLFALELAKAINCRTPVEEVEACDRCPSCLRIMRSGFPAHTSDDDNKKKLVWSEHRDVALVRPYNRNIAVDKMRELEREANFRPFEGKARVFLIEDADRLNEASSNALLKTLEEPPPTTHLILITSRPASLLPTIRSRCQVIRFAPLSAAEIEKRLLEENKKLSQSDAQVLAHASGGSIGRALSTDLAAYQEQRKDMLGVLDALAVTKDRARLLRAAEDLCDAKRKEEYEPRLSMLETLVHDVWAVSLGAPAERLTHQDLREQLTRIGQRLESRRAARWLSQIDMHRRQLEVNINRKVATDALFLAMSEENHKQG
jgi:DNA polymerase-3 subunit delta'